MVRVSPLATASWVARVPHRRAATATAPRTARRGAGARRTQPDAAAKRPDPKLLKSSSPLSATWRGLFGEGRLAGNGYRPVKPTNPVVPSGALGRTMANSGPQRLARPLTRHPPPARMLVHRHRRPHRGLGAWRGAAASLPLRLRLGRNAGAVAWQAEGEPDLVVDRVEVGDLMQLALVVGQKREIGQVDRDLLGQPDGALALADEAAQASLAPLRPEHELAEAERLVETHAAVAEGALLGVEQAAVRRVVQVDGVLIREHELDEAERVALARRLAHRDAAVAGPHDLIAARGGVGRVGVELVLEDRRRHVPGRVDDRVLHRVGEQRG